MARARTVTARAGGRSGTLRAAARQSRGLRVAMGFGSRFAGRRGGFRTGTGGAGG